MTNKVFRDKVGNVLVSTTRLPPIAEIRRALGGKYETSLFFGPAGEDSIVVGHCDTWNEARSMHRKWKQVAQEHQRLEDLEAYVTAEQIGGLDGTRIGV